MKGDDWDQPFVLSGEERENHSNHKSGLALSILRQKKPTNVCMPLEPTEISGKNRPKLVLLAPIWAELAASAFVCSVLKEDKHRERER